MAAWTREDAEALVAAIRVEFANRGLQGQYQVTVEEIDGRQPTARIEWMMDHRTAGPRHPALVRARGRVVDTDDWALVAARSLVATAEGRRRVEMAAFLGEPDPGVPYGDLEVRYLVALGQRSKAREQGHESARWTPFRGQP